MADAVVQQLKTRRAELIAELKKYDTAIAALEGAGSVKRRGRPAAATRAPAKRGRGAKVTKAEMEKMLRAGMTGQQIARKLGVSMPTVHNYKKKFGLTNPRGKTAGRKTATRKTASSKTAARKTAKRTVRAKSKTRRGKK